VTDDYDRRALLDNTRGLLAVTRRLIRSSKLVLQDLGDRLHASTTEVDDALRWPLDELPDCFEASSQQARSDEPEGTPPPSQSVAEKWTRPRRPR
jgi:hypothetical protein